MFYDVMRVVLQETVWSAAQGAGIFVASAGVDRQEDFMSSDASIVYKVCTRAS